LQSHTVETGAQEIAAIILATALLARERARAADDVMSQNTAERSEWLRLGNERRAPSATRRSPSP